MPDYQRFRNFLKENSVAFTGERYRFLRRMTDSEIDYVFERVREINVEFELEKALHERR